MLCAARDFHCSAPKLIFMTRPIKLFDKRLNEDITTVSRKRFIGSLAITDECAGDEPKKTFNQNCYHGDGGNGGEEAIAALSSRLCRSKTITRRPPRSRFAACFLRARLLSETALNNWTNPERYQNTTKRKKVSIMSTNPTTRNVFG